MSNDTPLSKGEKIPILSLFSGAGGLDTGFYTNDKFDVVFALDIEDAASKTYSLNHSFKISSLGNDLNRIEHIFALGDVKKIDMRELSSLNPSVIIGGPPCQDFSIIRRPSEERKGINVARGRLYAYFVKALIILNPDFFVFENVLGLAYQNHGTTFRVIKDDFSNLTSKVEKIEEITGNGFSGTTKGYELLFSDTVDSSVFGVPQKRQRLIIIGVRRDLVDGLKVDLEQLKGSVKKALRSPNSPFVKFPLTAMEVLEGGTIPELQDRYSGIIDEWKSSLPKEKLNKWTKDGANFTGDILTDYLKANSIKNYSDKDLETAWKEHKRMLKELKYYKRTLDENVKFDDNSNVIPKEAEIVKERMRNIPPGENYSFVDNTEFQVKGNDISVVYRRLHPLKPAYTVLAGGGGGTHGYHYLRERSGLTNRERARLQSFPDTFKFRGTINEIRRQIGEAVPPLVGRNISYVLASLHEKLLRCN